MKTKEFLEILEQNPRKPLQFEYQNNQIVAEAYHITEVKNVHVDSVDCGGHLHTYDETVVQLWIDKNEKKDQHMAAEKALKIFKIVDQKKPLLQDTPIFFEYGDEVTPTSIYQVDRVKNEVNRILVKMSVPATACKPKQLLNVVQNAVSNAAGYCGPGTGCC